MVDYFQFQTVLPVIILKGGKTVGALNDYLLYPALPEQGNVFLCHFIEYEFIPQAAHAIPAAFLILAEDSIADTGLVQQLSHGNRHMLVAGIKGAGASDIEQILCRVAVKRFDIHGRTPLGALGRCDSPGIAPPFHVFEKIEQFFGKPGFGLNEMTPHLDDLGHLFDEDRAGFHAGTAGGAGPNRFITAMLLAFFANQGLCRLLPFFKLWPVLQQVYLDIMNNPTRIKRFLGQAGGTDILATAALGAGKGIEQVFPGKMVNTINAKGIFRYELFTRLGVRLFQAAEETVGDCSQNMHVLAVGQVADESQKGQGMQPPCSSVDCPQLHLGQHAGEHGRHRHDFSCGCQKRFRVRIGTEHDCCQFRGIQEEKSNHQGTDQDQNNKCLGGAGLRERRCDNPADKGDGDRTQGKNRSHIDHEGERYVKLERELDQLDVRKESIQDELGVGYQQDQKSPENDEMVDAERLCQHPLLGKSVFQHFPYALSHVVKTVFLLPKGQQTEAPPASPDKDGKGSDKKCSKYGRL